MNGHQPVVRHFIACEEVEQTSESSYSLVNIAHAIRLLPGATFPCIHPELVLFVLMTDGEGDIHSMWSLFFGTTGSSKGFGTPKLLREIWEGIVWLFTVGPFVYVICCSRNQVTMISFCTVTTKKLPAKQSN